MNKWRQWAPCWMVLFGISTLAGCRRTQTPPEANGPPLAASSTSSTSEAGAAAALLPVANPGPGNSAAQTTPSVRATDERWQRAQGEDLADKQALADALGASGLLEALDEGGTIALTALLSLPLADDADIALGPLALRLSSTKNEARELYLTAMLAIAGRPARSREMLDPEGATQAGEVLLSVAKDESLPREHRALAISAARALAEKKMVDPGKIPTDLDPSLP